MKQLLLYILILASTSATAQVPPVRVKPQPMMPKDTLQQVITTRKSDYATLKDEKNGQVVYKGIFSWRDMEQEPTFSWMPTGMDNFQPAPEAAAYIGQTIGNFKLLVFMGTWCEDSQHLLPHLFKTLEVANRSWDNLMMIGMDRTKTTQTTEAQELAKQYNVTLLPTIILLKADGTEAGRMVETAPKSIEWALTDMISGRK